MSTSLSATISPGLSERLGRLAQGFGFGGRHHPLQQDRALPLCLAVGFRPEVGLEGLTHEVRESLGPAVRREFEQCGAMFRLHFDRGTHQPSLPTQDTRTCMPMQSYEPLAERPVLIRA
jgi:hypothetical protein